MENTPAEILLKSIHDLTPSRTVVYFFELNSLNNLEDLLKQPMNAWFDFIGFSQHLLNELMNYLHSHSLSSMINE